MTNPINAAQPINAILDIGETAAPTNGAVPIKTPITPLSRGPHPSLGKTFSLTQANTQAPSAGTKTNSHNAGTIGRVRAGVAAEAIHNAKAAAMPAAKRGVLTVLICTSVLIFIISLQTSARAFQRTPPTLPLDHYLQEFFHNKRLRVSRPLR